MIDLVQYRFRICIGTYTGMDYGVRGSGRLNSGQFHDSFVFNPYNTSESLLFYTLNTSSGFWTTNIIHSPMKLSGFSVFMYVMTPITFCMFYNLVLSSFTLKSFDPNSLNVTYVNQKLSLMCLTHIKIGYFCLLSSIILKSISLVHATRKYLLNTILLN